MTTIDLFDGISEFVSVAETGGFGNAARKLGVSTSHVSRKVSALEERLGVRLFTRTTRRVTLTEAGQRYLEFCIPMTDGLIQTQEELTGRQQLVEGLVRISAAGDFAERFLAPAVARFAAQNSRIRIELSFNSDFVNFAADGFDLAIRYGRLNDGNFVPRKLISRNLIAAASPAYLARAGVPEHPRDLLRHACLVTGSPDWRFVVDGQEYTVRISGRWKSANNRATIAAALAGLGISYMPESSYLDHFVKGELTPILKSFSLPDAPTWIVYPDKKYLPARTRRVMEYLFEYFADWPKLPENDDD